MSLVDKLSQFITDNKVTIEDIEDCIYILKGDRDKYMSENQDHTDDICPCGDPDCNRPFGHERE